MKRFAALFALVLSLNAAGAAKPNIVIVLCDDLGYGDLGCYGNREIKTPNLDRFAAQSLKFTSCYAGAPNCSPSRAALMTGRTPFRLGIYNYIEAEQPMHLRRSEITVATLLKQAGYATCQVGKWHLNSLLLAKDQPQPSDHGFDYWFATQNIALPTHLNPTNFVRNGVAAGPLQGYASQLVVTEAVKWLQQDWNKQQPFFLYVGFHEPHEFLGTAEQFVRMYPGVDDFKRAIYYGNVTQMDHEFGRLMRALDELKQRDNTLVFFSSDNGPAYQTKHPYGSAGPLRGKKGMVYEGGIRVPGILRWPGKTKAGAVTDEPIIFTDMLPTLCAITGAKPPTDRKIDGANFLPLLDGKPVVRATPLYWQFNRATDSPMKVAMRQGDEKILSTLTGPGLPMSRGDNPGDMEIMKKAELDKFELYDLKRDLAEQHDVATAEPERLNKMAATLTKLYHEIRAEGPIWPERQPPKPPSVRRSKLVSYFGKAPTLDGEFSPGEWTDATGFNGVRDWVAEFSPVTDDADLSLRGWVKHDAERLFFAFDITDDVLYGLDTERWLPPENPKAHELTREGFPWFGDEIEILLNGWNYFSGYEEADGNSRSWQMVCNLTKSRLGGIGTGGLLEGESRSDAKAWETYQSWIKSGAMKAVAKKKPGGHGYIIEWAIRFDPCVQLAPGKFYLPSQGEAIVGLNIAIGDLDTPANGAGNFGNFHHEQWWAGAPHTRTQKNNFGVLRLMGTENKPATGKAK